MSSVHSVVDKTLGNAYRAIGGAMDGVLGALDLGMSEEELEEMDKDIAQTEAYKNQKAKILEIAEGFRKDLETYTPLQTKNFFYKVAREEADVYVPGILTTVAKDAYTDFIRGPEKEETSESEMPMLPQQYAQMAGR